MVASDETNSHTKTIALFDVDGTLTVPRKVYISGAIINVHNIMAVSRKSVALLHKLQCVHSGPSTTLASTHFVEAVPEHSI